MKHRNVKTLLCAALSLLLVCGAAGTAFAMNTTAYVRSWEDLNNAAMTGKDTIIIMANITYGPGEGTVVFHTPISIYSPLGQQYTLDGAGASRSSACRTILRMSRSLA